MTWAAVITLGWQSFLFLRRSCGIEQKPMHPEAKRMAAAVWCLWTLALSIALGVKYL